MTTFALRSIGSNNDAVIDEAIQSVNPATEL